MSKIMRIMKWFREMSVLAEDEQRRSGHPEIDVEHLFLALLSIGGTVTDTLAEQGVTLARAREAFARLHARRAAQLGVRLPEAQERAKRIPDSLTRGGFVYRDGVRKMLELASSESAPDVALLLALRDEPSGHIREALRELDIDPTDLPGATGLAHDTTSTRGRRSRPHRSLDYRRFVPASPDAVWALVSDPDRWLEWNGFEFERVDVIGTGVLHAHARRRGLDGKPTRVKPEFELSEYIVSRYQAPHLIQWERSFPATGRIATQSLRIGLEPQGSGTEVTLSFIHLESPGRRGLSYRAMRPLARLVHPAIVRAHLRGKADNISRALRQ